jgi:hypothetical protein
LHHTSSAAFEVEPTLEAEIRQHQKEDKKLQEIRELLKIGKAPHFREDDQGTLWYKGRICVPDVKDLRKLILSEAHDTASAREQHRHFRPCAMLHFYDSGAEALFLRKHW